MWSARRSRSVAIGVFVPRVHCARCGSVVVRFSSVTPPHLPYLSFSFLPTGHPFLSASQVPFLGLDEAYPRGTIMGVHVCGCAGAGACVCTERVFGACIMFRLCSDLGPKARRASRPACLSRPCCQFGSLLQYTAFNCVRFSCTVPSTVSFFDRLLHSFPLVFTRSHCPIAKTK